jgi:hypothetical protein
MRGARKKHERAAMLRCELQASRGPHVEPAAISDDACDRRRARGQIDRPQPRIEVARARIVINKDRLLQEQTLLVRAAGMANQRVEVRPAWAPDPDRNSIRIMRERLPGEVDEDGKGRGR